MTSDVLVCVEPKAATAATTVTAATAATSSASADVAALHAELAAEEAALRAMAERVTLHASQLGSLRSEYKENMERVLRYYEPELRPLREVAHAAAEQRQLLAMRMAWVEQALATHTPHHVDSDECNDSDKTTTAAASVASMRSVAEAMLREAQQALQQSYDALQSCPTEALRTLSEYTCPPDAAIATMQLVLRLRGEEDCSWAAAQVVVSPNYLCHFFVARSEALLQRHVLLPRALLCALEAFFAHPAHAVAELYKCSTPIGCMGQWLHAVRQYYRVKLVTAPLLLLAPRRRAAVTASDADGYRDEVCACEAHAQQLLHELMYSSPAELAAAAGAVDANTDGKEAKDSATTPATAAAGDDNNKDNNNTTTAASAEAVGGEDDERALVQRYHTLKERLQRQAAPHISLQAELHELQHRMGVIDESVRAAEAAVADVHRRMRANVHDVLCKYDTAMLTVHEELEQHTDAFVRAVTHDTTAAAPSQHDGDVADTVDGNTHHMYEAVYTARGLVGELALLLSRYPDVTSVQLRLLPPAQHAYSLLDDDDDDAEAAAADVFSSHSSTTRTRLGDDDDGSCAAAAAHCMPQHTVRNDDGGSADEQQARLRIAVLLCSSCCCCAPVPTTTTAMPTTAHVGVKRQHDTCDSKDDSVCARYLVYDAAAHITPRWCAELQRVVSVAALLRAPSVESWTADTAMLTARASRQHGDDSDNDGSGGGGSDDGGASSGAAGAAHTTACRRVRAQQLRSFAVYLSPYIVPELHWRREDDGVAGTHLHIVLHDTLTVSSTSAAAAVVMSSAPVRVAALLNATLVAGNGSAEDDGARTTAGGNAQRVALLVLHAPDTQLATLSTVTQQQQHSHRSRTGTAQLLSSSSSSLRMTQSLFAFVQRFTTRYVMSQLDLDVLAATWSPAAAATTTSCEGNNNNSSSNNSWGDGDACRMSSIATSYYCHRTTPPPPPQQQQQQHATTRCTSVRNIVFVLDVPVWVWDELLRLHSSSSDDADKAASVCASVGRQLALVMHRALVRLALKHADVFGYYSKRNNNNNNSSSNNSDVHYPRHIAMASIADSIVRIVALSPNVHFVREVERLLFARAGGAGAPTHTDDAAAAAAAVDNDDTSKRRSEAHASTSLCRYTAAAMQRAIEDKLRDSAL